MNGIIYMRVSPTGSRYVGQTIKEEEKRWKQHINFAYNEKSKLYNLPLSRAIRKYGPDAFTVEILENGIDTQEKLDEREKYWIKEKHSLVNERKGGLNVTLGGRGYTLFTGDDFRRLYDEGLSMYEISQITGASGGTIREHIGSNAKENSKRSRLRVLKEKPPKSVSNYDPDTCEKVMTFQSAADASLYYFGDRQGSYITNAIYGNTVTAAGYLWKYDEQPMSIVYEHYNKYHNGNNNRGRSVVNVETGEVFDSALQASKKFNVNRNQIVSCCEGTRESTAGYHWRYENEGLKPYTGKHAKPIVCTTTGTIYPSVSEAARQTGIYINSITACLKGRRKEVNGLQWEYKNPADKEYGIFNNTRFKPVVCKETGVIYETMKDAASAAGVEIRTLRKHLNTDGIIKGLHWAYQEDAG